MNNAAASSDRDSAMAVYAIATFRPSATPSLSDAYRRFIQCLDRGMICEDMSSIRYHALASGAPLPVNNDGRLCLVIKSEYSIEDIRSHPVTESHPVIEDVKSHSDNGDPDAKLIRRAIALHKDALMSSGLHTASVYRGAIHLCDMSFADYSGNTDPSLQKAVRTTIIDRRLFDVESARVNGLYAVDGAKEIPLQSILPQLTTAEIDGLLWDIEDHRAADGSAMIGGESAIKFRDISNRLFPDVASPCDYDNSKEAPFKIVNADAAEKACVTIKQSRFAGRRSDIR